MKYIFLLLSFLTSSVCFGYSPVDGQLLLFNKQNYKDITVELFDFDGVKLQTVQTNEGGYFKLQFINSNKFFQIKASKPGFVGVTFDSVEFISYANGDRLIWKGDKTELWPIDYIIVSDTIDYDLTKNLKYVIRKPTVISKDIMIEPGTEIYLEAPLILGKGLKLTANGTVKDSILIRPLNYIPSSLLINGGASVEMSFCKLHNFVFRTNNIKYKDTAFVNIRNTAIIDDNLVPVIIGNFLNIEINNSTITNSNLFSIDSVYEAKIENNVFINTSLGQVINSKSKDDYGFDLNDDESIAEMKFMVVFDKNVFKSDRTFSENFIQNMNSSILFSNNKIETYRFNPLSILTNQRSKLIFINNEISGSFNVSASEVPEKDTYNRLLFVNNNIKLNGYSSFKNNAIRFKNNLLNLNSYQMTVNGVHDFCPCVETTLYLTSNTIVNGRLWFNTSTNDAHEAYMVLKGNIINAEIATSDFIATGNVLKKDLLMDYFKTPANITDDETMEGWVYHHDKRELFDGTNLYVDSDELLNNSAPYYHGSSPFVYDTSFETIVDNPLNNQYYEYSGKRGYDPVGTSLVGLFPEFKKPSCTDTCSISGEVYSYSSNNESQIVDVLITNQETGEKRVTSCTPGKFRLSYLPVGNYIAQVIPSGRYSYSSFYLHATDPKKASSIFVEGHVEGISLVAASRIVLLNTEPYNTNGLTFKMAYQDLSESDDELVYRGFKDESGFHNAAKHLPIYLQNADGSVVYFGITDNKGELTFERIPYGTYKVVAQRYGYKLLNDDLLVINSTNRVVIENKLIKDKQPTEIEGTQNFEAVVPRIMPNPFKDNLIIHVVDLNATIQVTDVTGKVIYDQKADNLISTINTSSWSNGVYIVRTGETTVKVIK